LDEWIIVLQISFPVVIIDEILKFVSRHYIDGNYFLFKSIFNFTLYVYYFYLSIWQTKTGIDFVQNIQIKRLNI
jgi:hypothetical protein